MRTRRSFTTALTLTVAIGAIGAPVAFGGQPAAGEQTSSRAGATIVRVDDRSGFDWADAGVGAAGGSALSLLGVGVVLLVSERRARSRPST
jgi:hypothetical protein